MSTLQDDPDTTSPPDSPRAGEPGSPGVPPCGGRALLASLSEPPAAPRPFGYPSLPISSLHPVPRAAFGVAMLMLLRGAVFC